MMRSAAAVGLLAACSTELPPYAEALVVADTDLPVPRVANRLRVDLYRADGTWFDSRDIARPDPRDWPVSFSVFSEAEEGDTTVAVRLRAYPEGGVRDYAGERFVDWGGPLLEPPPGNGEPRLYADGADVTPATEPEPLLAVDRLLVLRLSPGVRGRALVTLHAACAGTMVDLALGTSCVELEKLREPIAAREVEADNLEVPPSQTVEEIPCTVDPGPDRACVPGGAAILGSSELTLFPDLPAVPERIVVHRPFLVDRLEVTVARFRAALAAGFVPSEMPVVQNAPLGPSVSDSCTWSDADMGREHYGLSCVSWPAARELCLWSGGDLPSEAQFERMATLASEHGRSRYPWGDEPPTCPRASHGRLPLAGFPGVCQAEGIGPEPIDPADQGDVTREGVVGLGGGLGEWMIDSYADYRSACWGDSPLLDARCIDEASPAKSLRGGSWAAPPTILASALRLGRAGALDTSYIGFRCVYGGGG
jgi:formylglycine-generating enzyme required for sulfatase activity